jgi:hypothetical protein
MKHILTVSIRFVKIPGKNLVSDPIFNKGLAFPYSERDRLAIRGLVPPTL